LRFDILNEFNTLKQGDTKSEFRLRLLDFSDTPIDLTGKTVNVVIANSIGKVLEKTPAIDSTDTGVIYFQFSPDDVTGYGDMKLEVHVTDGGKTQIIPSNGYYKFQLDRSLDELAGANVTSYTLNYFLGEVEKQKQSLESIQTDFEREMNLKQSQLEQESIQRDDELQGQINTITSVPNDGNAEIAIARQGRATLGELTGEFLNQLSEQKQQDEVLVHGLNVLSSDQASPLKVEFYGVTRANLLGDKSEEKTFTADGSFTSFESYKFNGSDYLLFAIDVKGSVDGSVNLNKRGNNTLIESFSTSVTTQYKTVFIKMNNPSIDEISFNEANFIGDIYYKNTRLFKISQATYDKIGDLSLIGKDQEFVEKAFPYVNGVQSVVNPVVKVSGANLIGTSYGFSLHANAIAKAPYEIKLNAKGYDNSSLKIPCLSNQDYTFSWIQEGGEVLVDEYDANDSYITGTYKAFTLSGEYTFKTSSATEKIRIAFQSKNGVSGEYTFKNWMLNLGSEPRPFVPKNDSYLYAYKVNEETGENEPLILAGNDDKKDISYYNESTRRWEVKRWFEADKALDGSLDWVLGSSYPNHKRVQVLNLLDNRQISDSDYLVNHKGDLLVKDASYSKENVFYIDSSGGVFITISDTDAEGYDLTTTAGIQAYFNDNPYKLTYQLAEPIVEEVRVEGDLSIQGNAQVEVGEGVIVREKAVFETNSTHANWNISSQPNTLANYKVSEVLALYEGSSDITSEITLRRSYGDFETANGARFAIDIEDYDPTANYYVTYEILDKHAMTTNLNEVVAYYQNSIKSSIQGVVSKQTRIATDVSILFGTTAALLRIIKGLEGA
jgi:hypothetical protein